MVFDEVLSCKHLMDSFWLLSLGSDQELAFSNQLRGTAISSGTSVAFIFAVCR
jgi:hypothetical protein